MLGCRELALLVRRFDKNGFGLSVAETDRVARVIERDFEFLPDSREVHDRWRSLLVAHNIQGVQVRGFRGPRLQRLSDSRGPDPKCADGVDLGHGKQDALNPIPRGTQ